MKILNLPTTLLCCCLALPAWALRPITVHNQAERPWNLVSVGLDLAEKGPTSGLKTWLKGWHRLADGRVQTVYYALPLRLEIAARSSLVLSLDDEMSDQDRDGFVAAFDLVDEAGRLPRLPDSMHLLYATLAETAPEDPERAPTFSSILKYQSPLGPKAADPVIQADPDAQVVTIQGDSWEPVLQELERRKAQGCGARFRAWLADLMPCLPLARAQSARVAPAPQLPAPAPPAAEAVREGSGRILN